MLYLFKTLLVVFLFTCITLQGSLSFAIKQESPGFKLPEARELVLTSKEDIPKYLWIAEQYLQKGQLLDVISICTQILDLKKGQIAARTYKAVAQKGLGLEKEFDAAAGIIRQQAPDSPILYLALAQLYLSQKDFKRVESSYQEGIKSATDTSDLQMGLASLYLQDGRIEEAVKQYEAVLNSKGIGSQPFLNASFALCRIKMQQKKYDSVIEHATIVTELYPPIPQGHIFLAQSYLAQGKTEKAINTYKKLMSINQNLPVVYQGLALTYNDKLNDYQSALSYATEGAQKFSKDAKSQDVLGWILFKNKQYNKAFKQFSRANQLDKNNPQYLYHLGLAQQNLGKKLEAKKTFEKILNLIDQTQQNGFFAELKTRIDQCK